MPYSKLKNYVILLNNASCGIILSMFNIKNNLEKEMVFTNVFGLDFFPPKPATKEVAEWYKNTEEYVGGKQVLEGGGVPHTIKKCIPVFDAITAGYILYTQTDVHVKFSEEEKVPYYTWPSQEPISFHPLLQASLHPLQNGAPFPKWNNPYAITTPVGYSTLFIPPMHNPNNIFTILSGLVDTDTYTAPVNFPFVLNDIKWEGIIPAGTPIAQAIPIKRDSWKHKIGSDKERAEQEKITKKLHVLFFNSYKKQFWHKKEYR